MFRMVCLVFSSPSSPSSASSNRSRGDFPSLFMGEGNAPRASRYSTICSWPQLVAAWRAVHPSLSTASTLAPRSTRLFTMSKLSSIQAWCRAVKPSLLWQFTSAPFSLTKVSTSSKSPLAAAARKTILSPNLTRGRCLDGAIDACWRLVSLFSHFLSCSLRFWKACSVLPVAP